MARPKLLLLDEPSMGLAPLVVQEIFQVVRKLRDEKGTTVLLVEQNARAASGWPTGDTYWKPEVILEENALNLLQNKEVQRAYLGRKKKEMWNGDAIRPRYRSTE